MGLTHAIKLLQLSNNLIASLAFFILLSWFRGMYILAFISPNVKNYFLSNHIACNAQQVQTLRKPDAMDFLCRLTCSKFIFKKSSPHNSDVYILPATFCSNHRYLLSTVQRPKGNVLYSVSSCYWKRWCIWVCSCHPGSMHWVLCRASCHDCSPSLYSWIQHF